MIRLVIVAITVIGFLILSIPILFVEWIIGKFAPNARDISSLRIVQFLQSLPDPYRLYCKERNGTISASFQLDALSALPVSGS